MAGSIAISVGNRPCHRKRTFLVLTEVSHTKDTCTVLSGVKIAERKRIAQAAVINIGSVLRKPLRVGENIDIRLFAVAYRFGILVHLDIFVSHILEVQHPVVHDVLFSLWNKKMCFHHEFCIKTNIYGCMIHRLPA